MMFADKIFREYDVRGVYGKDYDADFAILLATGLSLYIRKNLGRPIGRLKIAIGRDARISGDELAPRFKKTFLESGFDVIDLGIVPTPLVYFSTFHYKADAAVSITGSHNPGEYNGFKICIGTATLHGSQIQEIKNICKEIQSGAIKKEIHPHGQSEIVDIISPYISDIKSRIKLSRKLNVVVDAGNGTGGIVGPKLLRELGCNVTEMYCEPDGTFPNHHPDPTELRNLLDLQKKVLELNADIGIAYDGDADRIGAVDEKSKPLYGDELMILYSREILSRKPGSKILGEVKCSSRLYDDIKKHGGKPIMWKTGHSLIKAKMKEERAELAGEMSGHMFFSDRYYGYDDAIYASARLLEIVANHHGVFSDLLADLPHSFTTPELRVDCEDEIKFDVVNKVKKELSAHFKTIDIDGVRIETDAGWGLLRASNTQPVVVMRFEANSQAKLDELKNTVETAFESARKTFISKK